MSVFSLSSSRKDAGGNRGLKQKLSIFMAKAKAKKNRRNGKKQRERNKKEINKTARDTIPKKDPVTYSLGRSSGICRELKLIMCKNNDNDTLLLYFPDRTKTLTDEKKKELKEYIARTGTDSISKIYIKNCHNKDILTEHEIIWLEERARKIRRYLKSLDIEKSKIKLED